MVTGGVHTVTAFTKHGSLHYKRQRHYIGREAAHVAVDPEERHEAHGELEETHREVGVGERADGDESLRLHVARE